MSKEGTPSFNRKAWGFNKVYPTLSPSFLPEFNAMNAKEMIQQIDKELSKVTTGNLNHRIPNIRMMLHALEQKLDEKPFSLPAIPEYPKPIKSGQVAIPEERVKQNNMGWNQFDFFAYELRVLLGVEAAMYAGWYAWKLKDDMYYFRWTYGGEWQLSDRYLKSLKADGWVLARKDI